MNDLQILVFVFRLTISGAGQNCIILRLPQQILVILEVVFQVFLRLLRVPQYFNQWACETGKHLHELSLYAHAMDYCLCRCYACMFHDIV